MKDFQIKILTENEPFYTKKGISSFIGSNAFIDTKFLAKYPFYKPLIWILEKDMDPVKIYEDIEKELNVEILDYRDYDNTNILFNGNNEYDLESIFIVSTDIKRINIQYNYSPVNSFYLMDIGNMVDIHFTPSTQDYYVISDQNWREFIDLLDKVYEVSEMRDYKLETLFNEQKDYSITIRHLKYVVDKGGHKAIRFLQNVLNYYEKKKLLTDRQNKKVIELIY